MLLAAHSWFSFKYGTWSTEALLREAAALGHRCVALADINCTAGHSEFFRQARDFGVRPVAGIDFRRGMRQLYVGIARDNEGLHHLNGLLTDHLLDGEPLPERPPELPGTFIIHPFGAAHVPERLREPEFIGVPPGAVDRMRLARAAHPPEKHVALTAATHRTRQQMNLHRLLRAIAGNTLHSKLTAADVAPPDERLMSVDELQRAYAHAPELLARTQALLEQCTVDLDFGRSKNRRTWSGDAAADRRLLRELALAGLHHRYARPGPAEMGRLEHELRIIGDKDFVSYFLINWDLVRFAQDRGFFHVGRGSGANSLVAYCLGITDVDPIELDLCFERFINPARDKPPDFDIDFSWKDRDEVIRHLFRRYGEGRRVALLATYSTFQERAIVHELGKVFGLPPHEIDALAGGGDTRPRWIGKDSRLRTGGRVEAPSDHDPIVRAIRRYAPLLRDMPAHLGIHVGGVLIGEHPLTRCTALHRPPKGFATTQFSMLEAEDLGLYKFDILSQRGLGHIRDAVELVNGGSDDRMIRRSDDRQGGDGSVHPPGRPTIDIHDIPRFKQDPAIKELLRTGDTIGCFYVESPAMRMLLKKLKVDDYPGLVAASSIIRPGVAESGMMREYLLRHHDPERRKLAPKRLLEIMPGTYGVMVYQEDVIRVGHEYAGLSLAEADVLRRGMSGKYRGRREFAAVKERFFRGALANGHPRREVEELWAQIESFGDFSFAKGHSASYAVESYQSLYLKAHHPLEFLVAVANNFGGFYSTEFYLHEAKRAGAVIEAPCVNASEALCSLVKDRQVNGRWRMANGATHHSPTPVRHSPPKPRIFLGLFNIKGLEAGTVQLILNERRRHGPFADLQDLLKRVPLPMEQARILIRVGALRFTGRSKPQLLWDLTLLHPKKIAGPERSRGGDLFITRVEEPRLPHLHHHPLADAYDELELLGFPLCDPFALVECGSEDQRISGSEDDNGAASRPAPPLILKRDMEKHIGQRVQMLGYMVHLKPATTHLGQRMSFGSFIDTAGDFWDSTQFPSVAAQYPFRGRGVYRLIGVVEEEFGHCALRTISMEKLPWKADPRYGGSKSHAAPQSAPQRCGSPPCAHWVRAFITFRQTLQAMNRTTGQQDNRTTGQLSASRW